MNYESNIKPAGYYSDQLTQSSQIFYGFVQQDGMYKTLQLLVTDEQTHDNYNDYYKNDQRWYLVDTSTDLKELIHKLWFDFSLCGVSGDVIPIQLKLEDDYIIEFDTIKKMFAEQILARK